ncbi:MAG: type II toxin-antitoxin system prevent-host-death family antitoxin [Lachnospiraceae bacterium]|nr:type II toxin-antitoxin system prevent-host-death family antitoxin [Lachnospiraceae bacterium]
MSSITATELKQNLGKYLLLAETEDVYISKNGRIVAKLSNPYVDKIALVESLVGIIPADITLEEAREERLSKI